MNQMSKSVILICLAISGCTGANRTTQSYSPRTVVTPSNSVDSVGSESRMTKSRSSSSSNYPLVEVNALQKATSNIPRDVSVGLKIIAPYIDGKFQVYDSYFTVSSIKEDGDVVIEAFSDESHVQVMHGKQDLSFVEGCASADQFCVGEIVVAPRKNGLAESGEIVGIKDEGTVDIRFGVSDSQYNNQFFRYEIKDLARLTGCSQDNRFCVNDSISGKIPNPIVSYVKRDNGIEITSGDSRYLISVNTNNLFGSVVGIGSGNKVAVYGYFLCQIEQSEGFNDEIRGPLSYFRLYKPILFADESKYKSFFIVDADAIRKTVDSGCASENYCVGNSVIYSTGLHFKTKKIVSLILKQDGQIDRSQVLVEGDVKGNYLIDSRELTSLYSTKGCFGILCVEDEVRYKFWGEDYQFGKMKGIRYVTSNTADKNDNYVKLDANPKTIVEFERGTYVLDASELSHKPK